MIIFTLAAAAAYSVACVSLAQTQVPLVCAAATRPGCVVNKETSGGYNKNKEKKKGKKGKTLGRDQSSRNVAAGRPTVDQLESQNMCTAAWGPQKH